MSTSGTIDILYKKNFSKMVIALARYTGLEQLGAAEDIVQEAFLEATLQWKDKLPDYPEAWIYRVCRNIAFKKIRDDRTAKKHSLYESEKIWQYQVDRLFEAGDGDDQLIMLFACVHPHFSPRNQVIFALRYVAGFRIEQIANVLGNPPDTISKTLLRMREAITRDNIRFRSNVHRAGESEVAVVLKVLYLMFNEGYKTSHGKNLLNLEMCEDALSLVLDLVHSPQLCTPDAHSLLSLFLFNLSRFEARFDAGLELVDLEHQDRGLWNQDMTQLAVHHFNLSTETSSSYRIEAAISYMHTSSPSFAATDWRKIAALYERLVRINDTPFSRLNLAIAHFYSGELDQAAGMLKVIGQSAFIQQYHLFHVAMGKLLARSGDNENAVKHFRRAVDLAAHDIEKRYILRLIEDNN